MYLLSEVCDVYEVVLCTLSGFLLSSLPTFSSNFTSAGVCLASYTPDTSDRWLISIESSTSPSYSGSPTSRKPNEKLRMNQGSDNQGFQHYVSTLLLRLCCVST